MTRRDWIRLGILAGASASAPQLNMLSGQFQPSSPPTKPFQAPLPLLPELQPTGQDPSVDSYQISIRPSHVEILPGLKTTIWGYNGMYPGPTIRARVGRVTRIVYRNELSTQTTVHLHGGHTPADSDGHPTDLFSPGD